MKEALLALVMAAVCATAGELPSDHALKPVKVADVPDFCEGVVFDAAGTLFVSDTKGGIVYTVSPGGKLTQWAKIGAPNGHKVLPDGTHLVCDASRHAVVHLAADGSILGNAAAASDGKPLKAPNDLTLDSHGGF